MTKRIRMDNDGSRWRLVEQAAHPGCLACMKSRTVVLTCQAALAAPYRSHIRGRDPQSRRLLHRNPIVRRFYAMSAISENLSDMAEAMQSRRKPAGQFFRAMRKKHACSGTRLAGFWSIEADFRVQEDGACQACNRLSSQRPSIGAVR